MLAKVANDNSKIVFPGPWEPFTVNALASD